MDSIRTHWSLHLIVRQRPLVAVKSVTGAKAGSRVLRDYLTNFNPTFPVRTVPCWPHEIHLSITALMDFSSCDEKIFTNQTFCCNSLVFFLRTLMAVMCVLNRVFCSPVHREAQRERERGKKKIAPLRFHPTSPSCFNHGCFSPRRWHRCQSCSLACLFLSLSLIFPPYPSFISFISSRKKTFSSLLLPNPHLWS